MNRLLLVAAALVFTLTQDPQDPQELRWYTDLDAANAAALESDKPLLIVFR
ncbi:MAG: hypothetical protein GY711_07895 [bacterium]|nr:hypothetical protein [bacterium]